MLSIEIYTNSWELQRPFVISRLVQNSAELLTLAIRHGGHYGWGECEFADAFDEGRPVLPDLEQLRHHRAAVMDPECLAKLLPAGNARNAVDCAYWDLRARVTGQPVWQLLDLAPPRAVPTAFTLSLDTPEAMATVAAEMAMLPLLKLKLGGGDGDVERVARVREAAPRVRLIADANQAWDLPQLRRDLPQLARYGVEWLEQPLPVGQEDVLRGLPRALPLCADESFTDRQSLPQVMDSFDMVNIKLDKAGGLSEALACARLARDAGLQLMVGCNLGTSLAMAPALLLAPLAVGVDLDGPLLLLRDRDPGLHYQTGWVGPGSLPVWGGC